MPIASDLYEEQWHLGPMAKCIRVRRFAVRGSPTSEAQTEAKEAYSHGHAMQQSFLRRTLSTCALVSVSTSRGNNQLKAIGDYGK
eukprot:859620-Amphidinium_carterae.1